MKIFKASLLVLAFIFSIAACKPKQSIAEQPKTETAITATEKTVAMQPVAVKKDSAYLVVSIDRMKKTVYRGIRNPLTIVVPNAVSTKVEGNGLMKTDNFGHYDLRPGTGTKAEIKITAVMPDGSTFNESRSFTIRNLPGPKSFFGGVQASSSYSIPLTEPQIKANEVSLMMVDFDYDLEFTVTGFDILFPSGKKVSVKGNRFDAKSLELLKKVRHNGLVIIQNISADSSPDQNIALFHHDPIAIKLNKKTRSKK